MRPMNELGVFEGGHYRVEPFLQIGVSAVGPDKGPQGHGDSSPVEVLAHVGEGVGGGPEVHHGVVLAAVPHQPGQWQMGVSRRRRRSGSSSSPRG